MKIVQKGNKQLRVADEQLKNYLDQGYDQVDEKTGKVIAKKPDELKALKAENATLKKANKELNDKVTELTAKLTPSNIGPGTAAQ